MSKTREAYGDRAFDGESILRDLYEMGIDAYIEIKQGHNCPRRGFRKKLAKFKRSHPKEWRSKYHRRLLIESSYHVMKAVTGETLSGRIWWMVGRYRP